VAVSHKPLRSNWFSLITNLPVPDPLKKPFWERCPGVYVGGFRMESGRLFGSLVSGLWSLGLWSLGLWSLGLWPSFHSLACFQCPSPRHGVSWACRLFRRSLTRQNSIAGKIRGSLPFRRSSFPGHVKVPRSCGNQAKLDARLKPRHRLIGPCASEPQARGCSVQR
jgi:hypothetical protein